MSGAGERYVPESVIENDVCHADEHVLLDVGIKLPVYFLQNVCRRWTAHCLAPQDAATDCHDDGCRHAFAGDVGDCNAETRFVNLDVVEVIAAHMPRRNVETADLE